MLEADVRLRRFQVWTDEGTAISVQFSETQEEVVTSALKDHRSVRISVRGRADISPEGKPIKFAEVKELKVMPAGPTLFDSRAPAIEDVLTEIAAEVPDSEWAKLPEDLTDQLDHYLYGTPRQ